MPRAVSYSAALLLGLVLWAGIVLAVCSISGCAFNKYIEAENELFAE
jgi:hypothetical protein